MQIKSPLKDSKGSPQLQISLKGIPEAPLSCESPHKVPRDCPQPQITPKRSQGFPSAANPPQRVPQDYPQPQSAAPQRDPPGAAHSPRSARWGAGGCCGGCWGCCCCCSGGCCCCRYHCWSSGCSPGQRRPQFLCLHLGPHEHNPGNKEQKFRFENLDSLSQHSLKATG